MYSHLHAANTCSLLTWLPLPLLLLLLTACPPPATLPDSRAEPATTAPTDTQHGVKRITIPADTRVSSQNARCTASDLGLAPNPAITDKKIPGGTWPDLKPSADACGDPDEDLAFRLMNCEREARDLDPLACDLRLVWLSRQHGADMRKHRYFGHKGHNGSSPFDRMKQRGIRYKVAAENIAQAPDVEQAHFIWMDSDGHRKNILKDDLTHAGIGVIDAPDGPLLVTSFITPP